MKIIDFLNSKKTFNNILEILKQKGLDCKKLPDGFFIAGGSVSNIIISMLHGGEPVINDIDVYIKTTKKDVVVGDSWYPSTYTTEDNMEIMDDSYGRIFVAEGGDRMRVLSHSRDGILNIIEYVYEKVSITTNDTSEIGVVIEGFDLNCCMSGIDLINEKLVYNKHFVDYLINKQLKVVNPLAPIQTTIRIYKKIKDLNCYCNLEHEMRFLTVASKKISGNQISKYVGPETEAKYRKYKDFVSKYFVIREPKNIDEVPYTIKDKYFIDGERNPNFKIWLYDAVMDFNIVEDVNSALKLNRIWYLLYTPKKKSEQDKINKIFYKNVFTGNMNEDIWEIERGFPQPVKIPTYISNRFTTKMLIIKKNYHKCDFTIKHLCSIDTFNKQHHGIGKILSLLDTVSEQYKMVKFIKSLAKKEGEWIIGLLEGVDQNQIKKGYTEKDLLKILEEEKNKNNQKLAEALNIEDFDYVKNVNELTTNIELMSEGMKMGHCVGGYGNQIKDGYSRIFHIDCDGIGSTLEISVPKLTKTEYDPFHDYNDDIITIDEVFRLKKSIDKFIVRYTDDSTKTMTEKDLGYKIRQHNGRYPEKGNLKPTENNIHVANELIDFLNQKYFLEKFNIDLTENFVNKKNIPIFV